jgi:tetratricopeptide (TPR) repeat protein
MLSKIKGKLDEAIASYNKALSLKPDNAEAYNNMGAALKDQGKLEEAIASYNKALSLKPDNAEAYNNMGNALKDQSKLDEAIASYNKALSLKPDYAEAYNNMGNALQEQGKLDEAIAAYNKALSLKPDYAEAYYNLSFPYLLQGNLDKGFGLSEWRMKKDEPIARLPRTGFIWDGKTSCEGKSFVIYEEQGLGDIIQFCRYLPLLEQKGLKVTFKLKSKLHKLLKTLESDAIITDQFPTEEKIDFEAPMMSLPHLFGTDFDTIPAKNAYLYADHRKDKDLG